MGRVALSKVSPSEARNIVARHLQKQARRVGVNFVQFEAQKHEEAMVDMLAGFAMDMSNPVPLRRLCALDVITLARGPVQPWKHDGLLVDPAAPSATGVGTVGDDMDSVRASTALFEEFNDLVTRRVPVSQWPEHIRDHVGDAITAYSEEGVVDTVAE